MDGDREQELEPDGPLVATDGCLASEVDDERVLLDTETGTYYGLNPVGSYLWEQLQEPHTADTLVSKTAAQFDVSESECREDVRSFLSELRAAGLAESV